MNLFLVIVVIIDVFVVFFSTVLVFEVVVAICVEGVAALDVVVVFLDVDVVVVCTLVVVGVGIAC